MNINKVIWREGMLLRPQHFQHNDRYYDHQIRTRTRLLNGYSWGFLTLEIDTQFLNMGQLVVSVASGILPDGSLFDLAGLPQPLTLLLPSNTRNTAVYLALPLITGNHIETRLSEESDVLARYISYEVPVSDANAGNHSSHALSCARPCFQLLLGDEQTDQAYVKLKVCEVLDSTPDGVISLASGFVPTFIHAHGSAYLLSCLKEVISLLASRGDAIAQRVGANGKVGGAEVGDFMMLQLINRTEVLLRHYQNQENVHPETLYRELLGMLGDLATFACESKRPVFECRYLHSDQGQSFRQLMEGIRQVLSMVLEQHAIELPLEIRHYGVMVSPLHDLTLLDSSSFVLAASAACDTEELRHRLPAHLKIGPVEGIRDLVNLHLPGIKFRPLPVAPREIPFHGNKTYFILEFIPDDLAQLQRSGGIAFHASGEFPTLELKLWAIRN